MPEYIYGCGKDKTHDRVMIAHALKDNPIVECSTCGAPMKRVPQPFRFGRAAIDILYDWSEENLRRYKARKRGFNTPRFSPNRINTPDETPFSTKEIRRNK